MAITLTSTVTCPSCALQTTESMPAEACQVVYLCARCGTRLRPRAGDCCIFCSYGSVPCPSIQEQRRDAT